MATTADEVIIQQTNQCVYAVTRKNHAVLQKSFFFESYIRTPKPILWWSFDYGFRRKRKNKAYLVPSFFMFISLIPTGSWVCATKSTSGSWTCS